MVLVAWHSDRVDEKALHVAIPYLIGGLVMMLFGPMASASFAAGFANIVIAATAANAATGVISSRVVGRCLCLLMVTVRGVELGRHRFAAVRI